MNWQRASIQTAAAYMRELIASGADDVKTKAVYEGLLDVLDPTRRTARMQRESLESAKAAVVVQTARERRNRTERRLARARATPPGGVERRGQERRNRGRG